MIDSTLRLTPKGETSLTSPFVLLHPHCEAGLEDGPPRTHGEGASLSVQ
jgi:hypothetical protein